MKQVLIIFILVPLFCFSQKQGNIWHFGIQSGLDFSSGVPVAITGGQTGTDTVLNAQEGTSCISDSAGNLLFYTSGKTIWNRFHNRMPNGSGLAGGQSSTQSSLIVPLPGNDNLFYVFTSDEFQSYPLSRGYRYSIVDMCLDNEQGNVTAKNILLADSSTEKLASCIDSAGSGYWIMGHKMFSDEFHAWHLTSAGITDTVISQIGTLHGWPSWAPAAQGQMKFNSTGTKLALAISNNDPAILDLFDFNNATGVVSNLCHMVIDSILGGAIYGLEFSPDGSKLYAARATSSGGKRLYQYDLTAGGGNCSSVISSRTTIYQSYANSVWFGMQIAPDNKIYLVGNSYYDLGCINFPNLTGPAVGYDSSAVTISGVINNYTLPGFIAGYNYHNTIPNCSKTSIAENNQPDYFINVFPNPFTANTSISFNELQKNITLKIINMLGKEIKEVKFTGKELILERGEMNAGIYFLYITDDKKHIVNKKIIIQ